MEEKQLNDYSEYLSRAYVLNEMVKYIQGHELSLGFLRDNKRLWIRYLLCRDLKYLIILIQRFQVKLTPRNFYISCSHLDFIPPLPLNLKIRKLSPEYKEFDKNYEKHITGYDFFIDMDGKEDFKKCLEETRYIKKIFDENKLPYYILNSSFTGFHIIIPFEYLPIKPIKELLADIRGVINNLKMINEFETLDEGIVDIKRLRKVPYSPIIDGSICIPLTDEQINNFNVYFCSLEGVRRHIHIKDRGLLIREHGLSFEELRKNTKEFFKQYG